MASASFPDRSRLPYVRGSVLVYPSRPSLGHVEIREYEGHRHRLFDVYIPENLYVAQMHWYKDICLRFWELQLTRGLAYSSLDVPSFVRVALSFVLRESVMEWRPYQIRYKLRNMYPGIRIDTRAKKRSRQSKADKIDKLFMPKPPPINALGEPVVTPSYYSEAVEAYRKIVCLPHSPRYY